MRVITYGPGGLDPTQPNDNIIKDVTATLADGVVIYDEPVTPTDEDGEAEDTP